NHLREHCVYGVQNAEHLICTTVYFNSLRLVLLTELDCPLHRCDGDSSNPIPVLTCAGIPQCGRYPQLQHLRQAFPSLAPLDHLNNSNCLARSWTKDAIGQRVILSICVVDMIFGPLEHETVLGRKF